MKQMIFRCTLAVLLALATLPSLALADFYVIPVVQKMKNVVTVAKSGGKFTDVKAAMDSITDASENNPYLVLIGPGVYTMTSPLQLKAYVTVTGSGEQATLLKGAISTESMVSSSIILGTDNATLTQLSVENTGGGYWCFGIANVSSSSPTMTNVTATASGGNTSFGVYNESSSPTMTNVTAMASGVTYSRGVANKSSSSPTMTNVTATASGGTSENSGVRNYNLSSPTMNNVTATASGGESSSGIYNSSSSPAMNNVTATALGGNYSFSIYNDSSSPTMNNVTATASGGASTTGVYNDFSSSPTMNNVTATASGGTSENYGVRNDNSSSSTMTSVIATASGGSLSCGIYNSSSSPTMTNVTATASGGTFNYGVWNANSSPMIRNCTLKGTSNGVLGGTVVLSTVIGGGGGTVCKSCFDESGTALGTDCN